MDSDPDPKQEMHLIKNHLKIIKNKLFDIYDIKKRKSNIFFKRYAIKCHENAFFLFLTMWKKEYLKSDPKLDP
jgi:hypothetical protein